MMNPQACEQINILNHLMCTGTCTSVIVMTPEGSAWVQREDVHICHGIWHYGDAFALEVDQVMLTTFDLDTGQLSIMLDSGLQVAILIVSSATHAVLI